MRGVPRGGWSVRGARQVPGGGIASAPSWMKERECFVLRCPRSLAFWKSLGNTDFSFVSLESQMLAQPSRCCSDLVNGV